ncbi:hypothetical protein T4D_12518 [Trichinella pseudospiralis]|uniref:Ig-like domain-containing protein n=1 Tax=Trichinella pseudospiralis TaxID=6337 RepID=A0A0V1F6X6_TRIPS|nr:hypothetical protein T4D_12518 [Trichinella pseudospiralis]
MRKNCNENNKSCIILCSRFISPFIIVLYKQLIMKLFLIWYLIFLSFVFYCWGSADETTNLTTYTTDSQGKAHRTVVTEEELIQFVRSKLKRKEKPTKEERWAQIEQAPPFLRKGLKPQLLQLSNVSREVILIEGTHTTLYCDYRPNATDSVWYNRSHFYWLHNALMLENGSVDDERFTFVNPSVIRIYPIFVNDSGRYYCLVDDEVYAEVTILVKDFIAASLESLQLYMIIVTCTPLPYIVVFARKIMTSTSKKKWARSSSKPDMENSKLIDDRVDEMLFIVEKDEDGEEDESPKSNETK